MSETEAPDHLLTIREEMGALELKRGLVAAELLACEGERGSLYGPREHIAAHRRGALALDAVLGDEEAAAEVEALARRERYLAERSGLCKAAIAHVDERLEGLRRTYLGGHQAAGMDLEEIPEVLRERVREARERREGRSA